MDVSHTTNSSLDSSATMLQHQMQSVREVVMRARVLTSAECLKALQDKENLKQQKAEEKMQKQQERILKKQQKEEEIKRKKEEKICKTAIKEAQSHAKGNRKQCNTNNATECVSGTSGNVSIPNHTRNLLKRRIDGLSPRRPNEKELSQMPMKKLILIGVASALENMKMMLELEENG